MIKALTIALFALSAQAADIVLGIGAPTFTGSGTVRVATWASAAWSPLDLSPLAWYKAEDTATDSANAHNGTWSGTPAYATGISGKAFSFDGSSYIDIGTPAGMMVGGNVTLAAWVNPSSFANYRSIFGAGYLAGANGYGIGLHSGGYFGQFRCVDTASSLLISGTQTGWTHLVATRSGTVQEFWTNGVLAASETLDVGDATPSGNFGIGSRYSSELNEWGFNFYGLIDEVMLFGSALSESDIQRLYQYRHN